MDHGHAAPLTLLDALARAPAAAALVVGALGQEDRKALRLVHSQLRNAVGEATTKLTAALHRMPALLKLELLCMRILDVSDADLLAAAQAMPRLSSLTVFLSQETATDLTMAPAKTLITTGWRLEELCLENVLLGDAGVAALLAVSTFAIRLLELSYCRLTVVALQALVDGPWPLEELDLSENNFSGAATGPALLALSRRGGLRELRVDNCSLGAASFKALVEANWPVLTCLSAIRAKVATEGPHALGDAAFAGLLKVEWLTPSLVTLQEGGARLLAKQRWPYLVVLNLIGAQLGDAGLEALAYGEFPVLEELSLDDNYFTKPLELEDVRRWAPKLRELEANYEESATSEEIEW